MRLVVFSICKDEAATIAQVIERIPPQITGISEIIVLVVSDGSTDATAEIARRSGAIVIEGRVQRRLAFRFQQAVNEALSMGADIAVNIDGDLQFDPADIPQLVAPIVDGDADFVAADRFATSTPGQKRKPENMPLSKYWGNRLGARVVSTLSGGSFNDVTCGFRAYNRTALLALNINTKHTYTQESFQLLTEAGLDVVTMPVNVTYYPERESRVVTSIWSFTTTSAVNILRAYRDFAPLRFFFILGLLAALPGFAASAFVGVHWLATGRTSPYTSLGLVGVYIFSLGLLLWVVGLLADMQVRTTRNQEKILRMMKDVTYSTEANKLDARTSEDD